MLKKILALIIALCLFLMLNTGLISAETMSTNAFNNAIPLKFDSTDELSEAKTIGTLENQDDAKFYEINMEQNGELYFVMQQNLSVEIGVTLYDASGEKFETYYTALGDKEQNLFGQGLVKGTYYIKIFSNKSVGVMIPFQLDVTRFYGDNVESERNNTFETATQMKLGQYYLGYTDQDNTDDIYRFTTSKNGFVNLKGSLSQTSKITYRLFDDKGTILEERFLEPTITNNFSSIFTIHLLPGTYYISVSKDSSDFSNEKYEIQPLFIESNQFEKEANNLIKQANPVSLNTIYYGLINHKTDKDLYKFYVGNTKNVSLNFIRNENTIFNLKVINSKGKIIKTILTKKGDEVFTKLADLRLAKGTYYVDVTLKTGTGNNTLYNFSIK
ncbi:hypothetical protein [Bacillus sp. EAC]|uniref:hypothetical protein n=1 Tax=Bacillus sp. EAC TaxID=1978338 RepID=UPI000B43544B|nr:hypothetical protein [Bacillus sp. EAC]